MSGMFYEGFIGLTLLRYAQLYQNVSHYVG
jgi:hypothetical protein